MNRNWQKIDVANMFYIDDFKLGVTFVIRESVVKRIDAGAIFEVTAARSIVLLKKRLVRIEVTVNPRMASYWRSRSFSWGTVSRDFPTECLHGAFNREILANANVAFEIYENKKRHAREGVTVNCRNSVVSCGKNWK